MPRILVLIFISLSLLLSACSNQVATAKYRSGFNFSSLNHYSTYDRNSPFSEFQNISDTTRNSIEIAIEQILDKKGYKYKKVDVADVVVTYHLIDHNYKDLKKYNKGIRYCHWCLKSVSEEINDRHWQMNPGSLIIDLVNTQNNRSVWRSVYPLKIKVKDSSVDIQEKIVLAIRSMMAQLPINMT
ncbi:MAG: hypothetical protein ACI9LM_000414 [Alteromonadaceae bacterium]|jgi:hypothetical protein